MSFYQAGSEAGQILLQQTLSSASSTHEPFHGGPHHPITCTSKLYYEENDSFRCDHSEAAPNDNRTKQALNHSIAFLLIELAMSL